MSSQQLERELNHAREMGRWLSDDELEQLEHEQRLIRQEPVSYTHLRAHET